jgi:hypothetical protein
MSVKWRFSHFSGEGGVFAGLPENASTENASTGKYEYFGEYGKCEYGICEYV